MDDKKMKVIEFEGTILEIGELKSKNSGLIIEVREGVFVEISGFSRHDLMSMPNSLYKKVKVTIEDMDKND